MSKDIKMNDIDRWEVNGLIDHKTALCLREDLAVHSKHFNFAYFLSIVASVLVCLSIVTFVAANWQDIPRLVRVLMIFSIIFLGYCIGAWRKTKGDELLSEFFFLIGAIGFGSGIALIAQMYHISGDTVSALRLWCWATFLAALFLRSSFLCVLTLLLAIMLISALNDSFSFYSNQYGVEFTWYKAKVTIESILLLMLSLGLCSWTKNRFAYYVWLPLIGMTIFLIFSLFDSRSYRYAGLYIAIPFIIIFFIDWLKPQLFEKVFKISHYIGNWALLYAFFSLYSTQDFIFSTWPVTSTVSAILTLLLSLVALWSGRTRGWGTIIIAFVALILEILILRNNGFVSLMQQSVLFFVMAVVVFIKARIALKKRA